MIAADVPADHHRAVARTENAIIRAVNRTRRRHGLPLLRASRPLARVAARHSADLARTNALSHAGSDGRSFAQRIRSVTGAKAIGETIAATPATGAVDALHVVRAWLASPAHRQELLSRRFRRVGVAHATGASSSVITADFASGT